jgi:hypothetical protein
MFRSHCISRTRCCVLSRPPRLPKGEGGRAMNAERLKSPCPPAHSANIQASAPDLHGIPWCWKARQLCYGKSEWDQRGGEAQGHHAVHQPLQALPAHDAAPAVVRRRNRVRATSSSSTFTLRLSQRTRCRYLIVRFDEDTGDARWRLLLRAAAVSQGGNSCAGWACSQLRRSRASPRSHRRQRP